MTRARAPRAHAPQNTTLLWDPKKHVSTMEALVRSFVTKVQAHVQRDKDRDPGSYVAILLVALDKAGSVAVADTILQTLCTLMPGGNEEFHQHDGVSKVISAMLRFSPGDFQAYRVSDACHLLTLGQKGALASAIQVYLPGKARTDVLRRLFEWHIVSGSTFYTCSFLSAVALPEGEHPTALPPLDVIRAAPWRLGRDGLANPAARLFTFKTCVRVIGGDQALLDEFVAQGGIALVAEVAADRASEPKAAHPFLPQLCKLVGPNFLPAGTLCTPQIEDALVLDATIAPEHTAELLCCSGVAPDLLGVQRFVDAFLPELIERFFRISARTRQLVLGHLLEAAAHPDPRMLGILHDHVTDPPSRLLRALLLAERCTARQVVRHFGALLDSLDVACTAVVQDARSASTELVTRLDERLAGLLGELERVPELLLPPTLALDAALPGHLLFHAIDVVVGFNPFAVDTKVGAQLRDFLAQSIESARTQPGHSVGLEAFCRDVEQRYELSNLIQCGCEMLDRSDGVAALLYHAIPLCPVTLQPMHYPVVASDGYTYELTALLHVAASEAGAEAPPSPMTRMPLARSLYGDRKVAELEDKLQESVRNARRARRRVPSRRCDV